MRHAWPVPSALSEQRLTTSPGHASQLRVISLFEELQPAELLHVASLCTMQASEKHTPDHGRAGPDDGRLLHPRRYGTDQQLHRGRPRGDLHRDVRRRHLRRILRRRPAAALGFHRCPDRLRVGAHALGKILRGPQEPCRDLGAADRAPGVQDQEDVRAGLRSERARRARAGAARAAAPGERGRRASATASSSSRRRPTTRLPPASARTARP